MLRIFLAVTSLGAEHRLQGTQASVAVVHGPCCLLAHKSFLVQGSNLCPLLWRLDSSPLGHQGSAFSVFFFFNIYFMYLFGCAESSLQHTESIFAAMCHLSVAAMWIQFPSKGWNPVPCVERMEELSHWTTREVPVSVYFELCNHNSTSSFRRFSSPPTELKTT